MAKRCQRTPRPTRRPVARTSLLNRKPDPPPSPPAGTPRGEPTFAPVPGEPYHYHRAIRPRRVAGDIFGWVIRQSWSSGTICAVAHAPDDYGARPENRRNRNNLAGKRTRLFSHGSNTDEARIKAKDGMHFQKPRRMKGTDETRADIRRSVVRVSSWFPSVFGFRPGFGFPPLSVFHPCSIRG